MIKLAIDLTTNGFLYALIGTTLLTYSWGIFVVALYFFLKIFEYLAIRYLFLLSIPFFIIAFITFASTPTDIDTLFISDIMILIGGLIILITFLFIFFYLKSKKRI